jgi:hypothetical protein
LHFLLPESVSFLLEGGNLFDDVFVAGHGRSVPGQSGADSSTDCGRASRGRSIRNETAFVHYGSHNKYYVK